MAFRYGYKTSAMSIWTVTGSSGTIIAANLKRKYLRIDNTGGTPCYLGFGGAAAINAGPRINGAGTPPSFYEMSPGKGNLYTGAITGILTVAGTAQFGVIEGT